MLVSAAQQCDPAIYIHIVLPSQTSSPHTHLTPLGHRSAEPTALYSSLPLAMFYMRQYILNVPLTIIQKVHSEYLFGWVELNSSPIAP